MVLALVGCDRGGPPNAVDAKATDVPKALAQVPAPVGAEEAGIGTPLKDRVATIGLLNKRNNVSQDLVMKPGEVRRVGNVVIRLAACERTLPWEVPQEIGAFVQVMVEDRPSSQQAATWGTVFSGWLFRNSPSLNVVEHPVYDVWVKDCTMSFPGEEASPKSAASSSKSAKASGKDSAAAVKSAEAASTPAASGTAPAEITSPSN